VDTFLQSSFGTVVMTRFHDLFTAPSWQTLTYLACGGAVAGDRHTMTTSVWLTGAAAVQPFSRVSVFLGCPLSHKRWQLWGAVIRLAAPLIPEGAGMRGSFDDTTKKKAGLPSAGLARYRHGAGSARPEYRTLRGVNFVLGIMPIPLPRWPGSSLSVPGGCELSLKETQAHQLHGPYRSRSQWARDILDFLAQQVPDRPIRRLADGGYATKGSVRRLPKAPQIVGRLPISATLSAFPPPPLPRRRGAPRNKGALLGSPKTLAQTATGWVPHPSAAGAESQAWGGLGHPVWPGRLLRIVGVRREATRAPARRGPRTPPQSSKPFSPPISPCAPRTS